MSELPDRPYIRPDEAADFWGVSVRTIYLWGQHKVLTEVRTPSGGIRYTRESVLTCRLGKRTEPVA